jgi:hypothetical protein
LRGEQTIQVAFNLHFNTGPVFLAEERGGRNYLSKEVGTFGDARDSSRVERLVKVTHGTLKALHGGWEESHYFLRLRLLRQFDFDGLPTFADRADFIGHLLAFNDALGNLIDHARHFPLSGSCEGCHFHAALNR